MDEIDENIWENENDDGWRAYDRLDAPLPCGGVLRVFESFDPAPHGGRWTWAIGSAPPEGGKFINPFSATVDALLLCPGYAFGDYLAFMRLRAIHTRAPHSRKLIMVAIATLENWRDYP